MSSSWHQIASPRGLEPGCRAFQRQVKDGHLSCFVGKVPGIGWHLSISHRKNLVGPDGLVLSGRLPTWEEIKEARYRFIPNEARMTMDLPPKEEYVNVHPTTMHLWECRCSRESGG